MHISTPQNEPKGHYTLAVGIGVHAICMEFLLIQIWQGGIGTQSKGVNQDSGQG